MQQMTTEITRFYAVEFRLYEDCRQEARVSEQASVGAVKYFNGQKNAMIEPNEYLNLLRNCAARFDNFKVVTVTLQIRDKQLFFRTELVQYEETLNLFNYLVFNQGSFSQISEDAFAR